MSVRGLPSPRAPVRLAQRGKPPLYRLAGWLKVLATLVTVGLVLYSLLVGYSMLQFGEGLNGQLSKSKFHYPVPELVGGDRLSLQAWLTVSNQGFLPISALRVDSRLSAPTGGLLGSPATTGNVPIPAGGSGNLSSTLTVPFQGPTDQLLLVNDYPSSDPLLVQNWVNSTFASFFSLHIYFPANLTWGAPFSGLTETVSPLTTLGNGTSQVEVTVTFADHAQFPIGGPLELQLTSQGRTCGTTYMLVGAQPTQTFTGTTGPVYLAPGCDPHIQGQVISSITSTGLSVSLPNEVVP